MRFHYSVGLVAGLVITNSLSAQQKVPSPQEQLNRMSQGYPPTLYQMNDVSRSLNLNQQQVNNLNKLSEQTQAQYRDNYAKLNTLSGPERQARQQELNRQYYGDWNKGAQSIFNENQFNRYRQINYQHDGFNALYEPNIQKQLNLTPDQTRKLDDQRAWSQKQMEEINRTGASDATKGAQMYREYWKERDERFNKYLTPEQQKAWGEMTGERYQFQPNFAPSR